MSLHVQRMMAATVGLTAASLGSVFLMYSTPNDEMTLAAIIIGCFFCPVFLLIDAVLLPVIWTAGKTALSEATAFLPALRPRAGERAAAKILRILGAFIVLVYLAALVLCIIQLNPVGALFFLLRILHLVCLLSLMLTALQPSSQ